MNTPPPPAMAPPPPTALDRARDAWLAGDASAWGRYTACLRQSVAAAKAAHRPRTPRRARRPRKGA